MSRLTLAIAIAVFVICAALAAILYVSLVPYFSLLGKIALVILIILAVCAIVFALVFTYTHAATMIYNMRQARLNSNVVERAGIVVWMLPDGSYYHLSAEHEKAKVQPQIPQFIEQDTPDEIEAHRPYTVEQIVAMHNEGKSERAIAEIVGSSKTTIHNILTQYK